MDISKIVDHKSSEYFALTKILERTTSVIHIAGLVDTRENSFTKNQLATINYKATESFASLCSSCGVKRFVFVSSASATSTRNTKNIYDFGMFENSLLGKLSLSSYAKSKRDAELSVLSIGEQSRNGSTPMAVCIIRPHVIWGRRDTISTEMLLHWPEKIPHILVGDSNTTYVSIRADSAARYIVLSDSGLALAPDKISQKCFYIGDQEISMLTLLSRIVSHRGKLKMGLERANDIFVKRNETYGAKAGGLVHKISSRVQYITKTGLTTTENQTVIVCMLPWVLACLLAFISQFIDMFFNGKKNWKYLKLLSPNNIAYCYGGTYLESAQNVQFHHDCKLLYSTMYEASNTDVNASFDSWKACLPSDLSVLQDDYFPTTIKNLSARKIITTSELHQGDSANKLHLSTSCNVASVEGQVVKLKNRVIKAATFECMCDHDGIPTDELVRYHARMAQGGAAMTVVAYASVSCDGRSFPTQICLKSPSTRIASQTKDMLRRLVDSVHSAGGKACLQLTHAGAFADANYNFHNNVFGPSVILNPLTLKYSKDLQDPDHDHEMNRIFQDFVDATILCKALGFDAIEMHLGHGYLLSQFLSRKTNQKHALDPHARLFFPLRILQAVCEEAHRPNTRYMAVLVKFNVSEATEEDLPLSDVKLFASAFYNCGADVLVPSGGHVMSNGLHMLRGGRPLEAMAQAQTNTLKKLVISWLGEYFVAKEVYREAFFRERVISVMLGSGIPMSRVCLIGGVQDIETAEDAVSIDEFCTVQLGRVLLADPDWCIKYGISKGVGNSTVRCGDEIRVCDRSNECIVGATMALQPLRCAKYCSSSSDW